LIYKPAETHKKQICFRNEVLKVLTTAKHNHLVKTL